MKWLTLYVVVIVHLGLIPAVAYPLLYHLYANWRGSRVGRALMFKALALAGLFVVSVAGFWLPWQWLQWVYAAVVTAVTLALSRQVFVLVSVFRDHRPTDPRNPEPTERG